MNARVQCARPPDPRWHAQGIARESRTSPCAPPSGEFPRLAAAPGHGCAPSSRLRARALPAWPARRPRASGHAQPAGAEVERPPGQRTG
eukprot:6753920-Alexandrium_andersonii.AAC.1